MALSGQVVDFVRLDGLDDANEGAGVGHVAVMKVDGTVAFHVPNPFIEIHMLNASRVEGGRTSHDPMDFVTFFKKKSVLTRDAGDECYFLHD